MIQSGVQVEGIDSVEKSSDLKQTYLNEISSNIFMQLLRQYTDPNIVHQQQPPTTSERLNQLEHVLSLFKILFGEGAAAAPTDWRDSQHSGRSIREQVNQVFNKIQFCLMDYGAGASVVDGPSPSSKMGYHIMSFIQFFAQSLNGSDGLGATQNIFACLANQEQKHVIGLVETLLQIIESCSFVSTQAIGIRNEADFLNLVQLMISIVQQKKSLRGQHTIRHAAMRIIKNMLVDMIDFDPQRRAYANFDKQFENDRQFCVEFISNKFEQAHQVKFPEFLQN